MNQAVFYALGPGYQLHWYRIDDVLGQGSFGITYRAQDLNLGQPVAIKEYMPLGLAARGEDNLVQPAIGNRAEQFRWGLSCFLAEARTLAKFAHPNIVRVRSVFEANQSAYMVMDYEAGESLNNVLEQRGKLPEAEILALLLPLLDGLRSVHAAGFIHRDIKPANIFIRTDGSPVLLDFGSARQALVQQTHTMTSQFTPGYAPFEQYANASIQQGPWTDLYALAATAYRAVTGQAPLDALQRGQGLMDGARDPQVPARDRGQGRYSDTLLRAIDQALRFKPGERPQNVDEWLALLAPEAQVATVAQRDLVQWSADAAIRAARVLSQRLRHGLRTIQLGVRALPSILLPIARRGIAVTLQGCRSVSALLSAFQQRLRAVWHECAQAVSRTRFRPRALTGGLALGIAMAAYPLYQAMQPGAEAPLANQDAPPQVVPTAVERNDSMTIAQTDRSTPERSPADAIRVTKAGFTDDDYAQPPLAQTAPEMRDTNEPVLASSAEPPKADKRYKKSAKKKRAYYRRERHYYKRDIGQEIGDGLNHIGRRVLDELGLR